MRRTLALASVAVAVLLAVYFSNNSATIAQGKKGSMLSHDVFFTLKDNSPEAKRKLVEACKKYLSGHEGEVFFSAGVRDESRKREVNDADFDVALHIVFKDSAAEVKYQTADRHEQFIKENKDNWKKVRVFDSVVQR